MRQSSNRRRSTAAAAVRSASRPVTEALESRWLLAAAGDLDLTFGGGDGAATAAFTGPFPVVHDTGEAMAVRPDGKILVAGRSGNGSNTADRVAIARFTADGVLDATFNGDGDTDGKVVPATPAGADFDVSAMALQADGKIVLVGSTDYNAGNTWDWFVMRLNEDGSLDTSFGGGAGFVTKDFGFGYGDDAYAVAVQGDGKIVVTGVATQATSNLATLRLNSDGTPDSTFSGDGVDVVDFFGGVDYASDVIVDPDGKIVVAGGSVPAGGNRQFVLLRYTDTGVLDTTFDGDGKASTSFGAGVSAFGHQVLRQPDGKYVVGGLVGSSSVAQYAVARYTDTGALDATFGTNAALPGTTLFPSIYGHIFTQYGIARQADGSLLFGGYAQGASGSNTYFGAVRVTPAGAPDTTFGPGGVRTHDVPGSAAGYGNGADLALAADGNILIAGTAYVGGQDDFGLVKLKAVADTTSPVSVTLVGNVLTITGTDADDTVALSSDNTTFTVVANGVTTTFDATAVASINVDLKGGNDTQTHDGNVPGGTVNLGDGNDTLTVGTGNKASPALNVTGGNGNDTVTLGVAFFTPTNFAGGAGNDTLNYNGSQGNDDLVVTATDITNEGFDRATYGNVENIRVYGNFGFDNLRLAGVASTSNYLLDGGDGDDQLTVRADTDPDGFTVPVTLAGGAGNDTVLFDDSADIYPDSYSITPTTFTRSTLTTFSYNTAETLRVTAGTDGNTINVTPSATTSIFVDGNTQPNGAADRITVVLTGTTGADFTSSGPGSGRYTFANRQPVEYVNVETNNTAPLPPTVTAGDYEYLTRQAVTLTFSKDVAASLAAGDLVLTNVTTGQTFAPTAVTVTSVAGSPTTARWDFPAALPDGNYTATLPKGNVQDANSNTLSADYTVNFFIFAGDTNHDRTVNFTDLLNLAKNYNQSGKSYADGDFNYDGTVNFTDLLTLAKSYNKTLAAPAPAPAPVLATTSAVTAAALSDTTSDTQQTRPATSVFSTTPVNRRPATPAKPKPIAKPAKH